MGWVCLEVQTPPKGSVIVETDLRVKPSEALFQEIERKVIPWKAER